MTSPVERVKVEVIATSEFRTMMQVPRARRAPPSGKVQRNVQIGEARAARSSLAVPSRRAGILRRCHVHHEFGGAFVVDGIRSSVGTMNFDNRSIALNDESTLMVHDASFGRKMEQLFEADVRQSIAVDVAVDVAAVARRSWTDKVVEWGAILITPLL